MTAQATRAGVPADVHTASSAPITYRGLLITLCVAFCGLWMTAAHAQAKTHFDIAAGPAAKSLNQYAQQARVQLGFSPEAVSDIRTQSLRGDYEPEKALALLLTGTGLAAKHGAEGVTILRVNDPRKNAEQKESTEEIEGLDGNEAIAHATRLARSTDPGSEGVAGRNLSLEEILVTGSRIRGAQISAPLITISRSDIASAGYSTVEQLIDHLPQNFGGGANQENFSDTLGPAFSRTRPLTGSEVSIDLRGLGADATLVLLNGRRLAQAGLAGSFADVSSIPLSAVERIDVLTDGASAIYGADAIAGVVNFVLRTDYDGVESRLQYGPDFGTDTSDFRLNQLFGKSWASGNLLLSYDYHDQASLDTADRPQAASGDLTAFGGDNFNRIGGNPGTIDAAGVLYAIPPNQDGTFLTPGDFTAGTQNFKNRREGLDLRGEQTRHNVFLHLQQELASEIDTFVELRYATSEGSTNTVRSTINLTVPQTNPFFVDPSNSNLSSVRVENYSILGDIGPKVSLSEVNSYGAAIGASAPVGQSWELSLSGSLAAEKATSTADNIVNLVALNNALAQSDPELAFNPFADGSNTNSEVLEAIRTSGDGVDLDQDTWSLNLDLNGDFPIVLDRQIRAATGLEYREESIAGVTREGADTGVVSIIPGIDRSRRILAAYAELLVPLVGPSSERAGVNRLEVSLAGRYVDYSDFGDNTSPKLGLAWSPSDAITIRGTVGRSFKPPLMTQLDVSDPRENVDGYVGVTPIPAIFRFGGNENLIAQESTNWTAGFLFLPETLPGFRIAATYFDIDFENRIQVPPGGLFDVFEPEFSLIVDRTPSMEEIVSIASSPRWQGFGTSAEDVINGVVPVGAIVDKRMRNLAESRVSGVDLQLDYDLDAVRGSLSLSLNGSYLIDNEAALLKTLPSVSLVDTVSNPAALRVRGGGVWSYDRWRVSSFVNFTNSYTDTESIPERPISSWTTVDLNVAYETRPGERWLDGLRIAFTIQNAFDRDPPFVNRTFGLGFDPANASIFGRYISVQAVKKWL